MKKSQKRVKYISPASSETYVYHAKQDSNGNLKHTKEKVMKKIVKLLIINLK